MEKGKLSLKETTTYLHEPMKGLVPINFSLHLSTEQILYFLCSCSGRVFSFSSKIVRLLYYFFYGLAEHVDAHSCLLDKFSEYDPGLVAA